MRVESSITSITWIPSEAIEGMPKLPFEWGVAHYDDPDTPLEETMGELAHAVRARRLCSWSKTVS